MIVLEHVELESLATKVASRAVARTLRAMGLEHPPLPVTGETEKEKSDEHH